MRWLKNSLLLITLACINFCCQTVKPYEWQYVNDSEMQMSQDAGANFSNYVRSIREGATPIANPKSSGGCGCN